MKRKRKPVIVETRHDRADVRGVTYQRELVLCGKPSCRKRHGPYWYAYWKAGGRTRKRYVGKHWRSLVDVEVALGNSPAARRARLPKAGARQ